MQVGRGMRYVSSTTAGATTGGATIGPLNGVASVTVLRFDPEDRRMLDLQVIDVAPDGSATVGPREPFGVPAPSAADDVPSEGSGETTGGGTDDAGLPAGDPDGRQDRPAGDDGSDGQDVTTP